MAIPPFGTAPTPDSTSSKKGKVKLTNDLGGTADLPQVVATHLSSALPINQGGTGNTSGTATINANLTGDVTSVGNATTLAAGSASNLNSGTLPAGRMPALTGDVTTSAGAVATTLATVNSNIGSFGSATQVGTFTVNGKGLTTAAGNTTVTPAVSSITGLGSGVSTFLATPSSANLAAAVTDETGSGALVFGTSPTFITGATSPMFIASGLTGATASSRYVGATASGAPVSGTFAVCDYVLDQTGAIWICTVAGTPGTWVNPSTSVQSGTLQLALTETVNYEPNTITKGNTSLYISQSETLQALPKVSSVSASGTIWTFTFASSILGTYGQVGDTFQGWTTGFTTSSWNTGSSAVPVIFTVATSTTATTPNVTSPAAPTIKGSVNATPVQYLNQNVLGPPAVLQINGTNTFKTSVSELYGVGVGIQDQMVFINGTIFSASCSVTNGSNQIKILSTDARSSVFPGLKAVVPTGTPPAADTSKLDATAYVNDVGYDGTDTIINLYKANTVTVANWLGSTGTATIYFPVDITTGEQVVLQPITYATGAAPVSMPLNRSVFAKPGEGQGWSMGYWFGPIFKGFTSSDALININDVGFVMESTFGQGAIGLQRIGYFVDDSTTTRSSGSSANQGSVAKQIGMVAGGMTADATDYYPFVGAATANNNIGILNASTTYYPGAPAVAYATVAVTLEPSRVVTDGVTSSAGTTKTVTSATAAFTTTDVGANITGSADIPAGSTIVTRNSATSIEISQAETGSGSGRTLTFGSKTVTVDSTAGFPSSGTFLLTTGAPGHYTTVTYTGTTSTTFTGCTVASGTASVRNGVAIFSTNKYQDVSAGTFTIQAYGTTANLWSSTPVSATTSAVISTGTPPYDGQELKIKNVSASGNNLTITSGGSTGLLLKTDTRVIGSGQSLVVSYSSTLSKWCEEGNIGPTSDIQTYTATGAGTWTKPAGVRWVTVRMWGAGGGGGAGGSTTGAVVRMGGAGGGGGAYYEKTFFADDLGVTEAVSVGTGGTAGVTGGSGAIGGQGGAGGNSTFGTSVLLVAGGGGGGRGGAITAAAGGGGGGGGGGDATTAVGSTGTTAAGAAGGSFAGIGGVTTQSVGNSGGNGGIAAAGSGGGSAEWGGGGGGGHASNSATGANAGSSLFGGGGGGVGSCTTATPTINAGNNGGSSGTMVQGGGGSVGTDGASPTGGGIGTPGTKNIGGYGGGGGGGTITANTAGGAGGNGGARGGAGGGGGCGTNTGGGGGGGTGGRGEIIVISW